MKGFKEAYKSIFHAKSLTESPAESLGSDYMHDSRRDSLRYRLVFFTRVS